MATATIFRSMHAIDNSGMTSPGPASLSLLAPSRPHPLSFNEPRLVNRLRGTERLVSNASAPDPLRSDADIRCDPDGRSFAQFRDLGFYFHDLGRLDTVGARDGEIRNQRCDRDQEQNAGSGGPEAETAIAHRL